MFSMRLLKFTCLLRFSNFMYKIFSLLKIKIRMSVAGI